MADEAVRVGPPVAAESYLNMDAIFTAIEETGAKAVSDCTVFISKILTFNGRKCLYC